VDDTAPVRRVYSNTIRAWARAHAATHTYTLPAARRSQFGCRVAVYRMGVTDPCNRLPKRPWSDGVKYGTPIESNANEVGDDTSPVGPHPNRRP